MLSLAKNVCRVKKINIPRLGAAYQQVVCSYQELGTHARHLQPYNTRKSTMTKLRNKPELEYDFDDMSAGARLMRYYVSDEPRPGSLDQRSKSTIMTRSRRPTSELSGNSDVPTVSKVESHAEGTERDADSSKNDNVEQEDDDDNENDNRNDGVDDDTIFRRDLAELKGDLLSDLAGRYSHQEIVEKIATFHPLDKFSGKQLAWRVVNAMRSRANRQGSTTSEVRAELDATRIANGVEFPNNSHPKSQGKHSGSSEKKTR